ncbi:MAG TPA: tryptophan--tRNA ligase [Chloroflexota bacterium]|jgi:tryptophanyl-tRNA synthetase|nr:tryptophan--tRNA ligase [Chloroflexota bacterium]
MPRRIFSGMQPTGVLHLGSYYGALQNWVRLQDSYECIYCIVDQHALTAGYDPARLRERVFTLACLYLASGVDPAKSILFVQSYVPEHTELAWYLSTIAPLGQLERMTQFKDKAQQHGHTDLGLLAYPVLQAADILVYKADAVPVGEDQSQHLELTRDLAQRFNHRFGPVFPEPQTLLTPGKRIIALDNEGKMSKSKPDNTSIFMTDPPEVVWAKVRPATTDPARKRRTDPGDPGKCPIGILHRALSSPEDVAWVEIGCTTAAIGCIDCKKKLVENIEKEMGPIRNRYYELSGNPELVWGILRDGAKRAHAIASQTMDEVRRAMGLR